MKRFEYHHMKRTFHVARDDSEAYQLAKREEWYNALGADGWEIVSAHHVAPTSAEVVTTHVLLKREIDG